MFQACCSSKVQNWQQGIFKKIIAINKNSEIYLAGGIKDSDDLKKLNLIGVKGCLIATALHQKKITKKDLDSFFLSVKKMPRYSRH